MYYFTADTFGLLLANMQQNPLTSHIHITLLQCTTRIEGKNQAKMIQAKQNTDM